MIRHKFVRGSGITSWGIAKAGMRWGGFSHVAAYLPDGTLFDARADVQPCVGSKPCAGVQHRPDNYEAWKYWVIVSLPGTEALSELWVKYLFAHEGEPYDMDAIYGFILGRPLHKRGHAICSALQEEVLRKLCLTHGLNGLALSELTASSGISPDALFLIDTVGLGGKVTASAGLPP